jgi:hypothetical protein
MIVLNRANLEQYVSQTLLEGVHDVTMGWGRAAMKASCRLIDRWALAAAKTGRVNAQAAHGHEMKGKRMGS